MAGPFFSDRLLSRVRDRIAAAGRPTQRIADLPPEDIVEPDAELYRPVRQVQYTNEEIEGPPESGYRGERQAMRPVPVGYPGIEDYQPGAEAVLTPSARRNRPVPSLDPAEFGGFKPRPSFVRRAAGRVLSGLSSGESLLNQLGEPVGLGETGTLARAKFERVPYVGKGLGYAFDVGLSPVTLATAGIGPGVSAGLKGLGPVGRAASTLASPILRGGLATRLAGETAAGVGGLYGAEEGGERYGLPGAVAGGLLGGLGGAGAAGAVRGLPRGVRAADEALARSALPGTTGAAERAVGRRSPTGARAIAGAADEAPPLGGTAAITPDAIHKLADSKGIPWDNDPAFLARTKRVTGKEHLDDLTPAQLRIVYDDIARELPERTVDTMSESIALSSPSGHMSARARKAADERLRVKLFGQEGMPGPAGPVQAPESASLRRQAAELRGLASRGMKPRAYMRQAETLEAQAQRLDDILTPPSSGGMSAAAEGAGVPPARVPPPAPPPGVPPPGGGSGTSPSVPPPAPRVTLLKPRTAEALGPDYGVKDALNAASDLERQRTSLANSLVSARKTALVKVGRIDRTGHMLDVQPTALEAQHGLAHPSFYDVAQNPGAYNLTPRQIQGVQEFTDSIQTVRAEREAFGVGPKITPIEGDGDFVPRTATRVKEIDVGSKGGGGSRLGGGKDKARRFETAAEGEANGVRYAHPLISANDYTARGLKLASDEHVKSLLVPFSETSAVRVPPKLRAQVEGIRQRVASMKATAGRLSEREDNALAAFLDADDPNLDALRDTLGSITVGKNAVGREGVNFGKGRKQLLAETRQLQAELNGIMPEWRHAKDLARPPRPGRQTIPMDVAPALSARDFAEEDAKRIIEHYTKGRMAGAVGTVHRATNVPVRFLNATADTSAILLQQKQMAVRHPAIWAQNVAKSFRDAVDSRAYDELVGGPAGQKWAARGLAIFGDVGDVAEYQAAHWMDHIPIAKQANNHFVRFNTRMRIDVAEATEAAMTKGGKRVLSLDEEKQIATAINRATGVSATKGGDLESAGMFASRFFRSTVEEVVKAAVGGDIEKRLAREYLGSLIGASTFMVAGVALAQKRDLDEVLNPFDLDALKRGEIRMNSNFGTIRVFGQDVKPLGEFDSLARLATVGIDAAYRSITERDAAQLFDFIGYAASTKGSPLVSFAADLIKGTTFMGENPLAATALAKRVLPFTAQNIIEGVRGGQDIGEAVAGGLLSGIGLKSAPLSLSDKYPELNQLFDIEDDVWSQMQKNLPEGAPKAKSYAGYRAGMIRDLEKGLKERGADDATARKLAQSIAGRDPIGKAYHKVVNAVESAWLETNPEAAKVAVEKYPSRFSMKQTAAAGAAR